MNKKIDKEMIMTEKYSYLFDDLSAGKSFADIAKEQGVSKQAVHLNFKKVCEEFDEVEPKLKTLYENFDTFLDISLLIDKPWVAFVVKMMELRNKKLCSSHLGLKAGFVIDKKLHCVTEIKEKEKKVSGRMQIILQKNTPISIKRFSEHLGLNDKKVKVFLSKVMQDFYYIIDDFILHPSKKSFHKVISKYCTDENINYEGSLEEFYKKISKKYPKEMKNFGFKNYIEFSSYIQLRYHEFLSFITRLKKDKSYELLKYANKHKLELYSHHLLKSLNKDDVYIDGVVLLEAITNSKYTMTSLAEEINKTQVSITQWCKGAGKRSRSDVEKVAKLLNIDMDLLIVEKAIIFPVDSIKKGRVLVDGKKLEQAIENSPLTRVEIAYKLNRTQSCVSQWCKRVGTISKKDVTIIAKMLEIKSSDLILKK